MKVIYKSKIGIEIIILLIIIFSAAIYLSQDGYSIWTALALAPPIIFIAYLFSSTYYTIVGQTLKIKSGFLVNISIEINTIIEIRETNNILSAPALSLDRLEIKYHPNKSVLISPDDKEGFINHLLDLNPELKILKKS